jgi:uncharacterized membrane protein
MAAERLDEELNDQDKLLLVFGYLGPLALVTLVASRREFVKWHAKQGLVLSATVGVAWPVLRLLHYSFSRIYWLLGELVAAAVWLAASGAVLTMLVCVIRGLEGERFKLPMLGELADRL